MQEHMIFFCFNIPALGHLTPSLACPPWRSSATYLTVGPMLRHTHTVPTNESTFRTRHTDRLELGHDSALATTSKNVYECVSSWWNVLVSDRSLRHLTTAPCDAKRLEEPYEIRPITSCTMVRAKTARFLFRNWEAEFEIRYLKTHKEMEEKHVGPLHL